MFGKTTILVLLLLTLKTTILKRCFHEGKHFFMACLYRLIEKAEVCFRFVEYLPNQRSACLHSCAKLTNNTSQKTEKPGTNKKIYFSE